MAHAREAESTPGTLWEMFPRSKWTPPGPDAALILQTVPLCAVHMATEL